MAWFKQMVRLKTDLRPKAQKLYIESYLSKVTKYTIYFTKLHALAQKYKHPICIAYTSHMHITLSHTHRHTHTKVCVYILCVYIFQHSYLPMYHIYTYTHTQTQAETKDMQSFSFFFYFVGYNKLFGLNNNQEVMSIGRHLSFIYRHLFI